MTMETLHHARRFRSAAVVGVIALGLVFGMILTAATGGVGPDRALAQAGPFDCSTILTNGDFETPVYDDDVPAEMTGWTGSHFAEVHFAHTGDQSVGIPSGTLSQILDTSALNAGDTISISFWSLYNSVTASLNSATTTTIPAFQPDYVNGTLSYVLQSDAEEVTLSFSSSSTSIVDAVTVSCERAEPTPTATAVPTQTPSATATTEPTQTPETISDTALSVTGDPRFPITGSSAIPGPSSYALLSPPANGSVVVDADGSYSYIANNIWLEGDRFAVLATAPGGETATITVSITYLIDPTVPTSGTVKPGGSTGGGNANDARDGGSSQPEPTSVSADDDGRVARP